MPDVKSIDSLSLKITSSTEEAVKALNSLEEALLGVISATGRLSEASANVSTFSRSLGGLSQSLKNAVRSSKEVTFTGAETQARSLDKTIRELTKNTMSGFGVTSKKAFSEYADGLREISKQYQDGMATMDKDTMSPMVRAIARNTHLMRTGYEDYIKLADTIDRWRGQGKKWNFDYGANDLSEEARKVFKGMLTNNPSDLAASNFVTDLKDSVGLVWKDAEAIDEALENIAAAYIKGKDAFMDYKTARATSVEAGGTGGRKSTDAIVDDANALAKAIDKIKSTTNYGTGEHTDAFRAIADSVENLNGINVGDIQGIVDSVNSVRQLDVKGVAEAAKALSQLGSSLGKVTVPEGGSNVGQFIESLFVPLKTFEGLNLPDFKPLLTLQKALSGFSGESYTIASTNLAAMVPALQDFAKETNAIEFASLDDLNETVKAITKFGHANMQKAISNMPLLSSALKELVDQLNQLPEVSDKTLRLIEAISKIKSTNLGKTFQAASEGANGFGKAASKARGHTNGLLGVFMKARALLWGLRRAFDAVKGSINLASDLIEVQNVVDVTFGNYQSHLEEIAKNSIEAFGTSELTFKTVASQFQAMGSAMGIGNTQIREATENLKGMGVAYGETTGQMGDMATTLTELSADMASFYNKDIEEVQQAMTAVYTGMTRPLRAFGLDLTQANLKAWALTQGMNANIESMTQAEKTMLRYQYVLAHTTAAQGDFIRTSDRLCVA